MTEKNPLWSLCGFAMPSSVGSDYMLLTLSWSTELSPLLILWPVIATRTLTKVRDAHLAYAGKT